MNIFEKLKNILRNKKVEIKEETNLVLYDTSHIVIPKFKELPYSEKELVKKYQEEINVDDFSVLLRYAKNITEEGNIITNLLIDFLYKYEEEIERYKENLDEKKLNEERIGLLFLKEKITYLKKELQVLMKESILRTISLEELLKQENKKFFDFLGIFGEAQRIKRETLKRSLQDMIDRMKITIITLDEQIKTGNNIVKNSLELVFDIDIFNILSNNNSIKKEIYLDKFRELDLVYEYCLGKKLPNSFQVNDLIKDERELIKLFSIYQIEVDKFIYANKDNLIKKINTDLDGISITTKNKERNLEKLDSLSLVMNYLKMSKEKLYSLKFKVLTFVFYDEFNNPFLEIKSDEELNYYKDIVALEVQEFFKPCKSEYQSIRNRLLTNFYAYLKKDNGDINLNLLRKNIALQMILVVNHPENYQKEINEMIVKAIKDEGNIDCYYLEYDRNKVLSEDNNSFFIDPDVKEKLLLNLINENNILDRWQLFTDVKKGQLSSEVLLLLLLSSGRYSLKKLFGYNYVNDLVVINNGVTKISGRNEFTFKDIKTSEIVVLNIDKTMHEIVFPETLMEIGESTFKNFYELRTLDFPSNLKRINHHAFYNCYQLRDVFVPDGLEYIDDEAFWSLRSELDRLDVTVQFKRESKFF